MKDLTKGIIMFQHIQIGLTRTAYTDDGEGDTVVLLHGGFSDSRDFRGNLAGLSDRFRVLAPDRRGWGRTPDVPGPISLQALTDDIIGFITAVASPPVNLIGYSQGATIALAVAASRPELVRRVVSISGATDTGAFFVKPEPGGAMPAAVVDAYAEVSPDGREHFPIVYDKYVAAFSEFGLMSTASIAIPTLIMAADDDIVALEHQLHLLRVLPAAELAILPAASHLLLFEHPTLVTHLVAEFLERPQPATLMPLRRAALG